MTPEDFYAETVRQIVTGLTDEEKAAIMFISPRTPSRKPRTQRQGICLSKLGRHAISPDIHAKLAEETDYAGRWSPFRLTPLGLAVRSALEATTGTRPVREVGEATEGDRAAMAKLVEGVKI